MKKILRKLIEFINILIPKSNIIVFSSRPDFSDSAKVVFEAMKHDKRYEKYRLVWITRNSSKSEYENYVCYHINSLRALLVYLRARYVFTTHGLYDGTLSTKQIHVGLWHGMPLKKIGYLQPARKQLKKYTFVLATSPLYKRVMAECFKLDIDHSLVLGLPRNDLLFHGEDTLHKLKANQSFKTICWLPTFRNPLSINIEHGIKDEGHNYEFGIPLIDSNNIAALGKNLKESQINLVIKFHGLQKVDIEKLPNVENIIFLTDDDCKSKKIELYRLLACSDALITDYSSVYIDYLATNKPIAFTIDDIESYGIDRGFVFESPLRYMPGLKIRNYKDLLYYITTIHRGEDSYSEERCQVRKELNIFTDDKNTNRLLDYCANL